MAHDKIEAAQQRWLSADAAVKRATDLEAVAQAKAERTAAKEDWETEITAYGGKRDEIGFEMITQLRFRRRRPAR